MYDSYSKWQNQLATKLINYKYTFFNIKWRYVQMLLSLISKVLTINLLNGSFKIQNLMQYIFKLKLTKFVFDNILKILICCLLTKARRHFYRNKLHNDVISSHGYWLIYSLILRTWQSKLTLHCFKVNYGNQRPLA